MVNLDGLGVRKDQLSIFRVHQTEKVKNHCRKGLVNLGLLRMSSLNGQFELAVHGSWPY